MSTEAHMTWSYAFTVIAVVAIMAGCTVHANDKAAQVEVAKASALKGQPHD
jgi:hypothetical protein